MNQTRNLPPASRIVKTRLLDPGGALYLDLLELAVSGQLIQDPSIHPAQTGFNSDLRQQGWDWPKYAHTMIGARRLKNLRTVVECVLRDGVPGDLLEAGVWRGGACIFMRGMLKAYGVFDRIVWACDSFEGLPPPNPERYPADTGDRLHSYTQLNVSLEEVRGNFKRYGLLDDRVRFVKGWFKDTLPTISIDTIAVLRLDGDMYESTSDGLQALYDKVPVGGFVIVDDYALPACQEAVADFRAARGITDPILNIDGIGAYWRREN